MKDQRIAEQIAQVDNDLADIADQLEAGDLDEATAGRLRSAYQEERASLQTQLDEAPASKQDADEHHEGADTSEGRSRGRAIAGTVIVGIAAVVVAVVAIVSLQEQTPAGNMTDGIATDVLEQG
ncbi:MAG: hypothetical protein M3096_08775, partial [Actinomycetia bacterium]|nr:hypothetical protein [Actinomycetes bacterium]